MNDIKVLGIDLAKNVFQLHGTDAKGNRLVTKRLNRGKLIEYMANTTPCLVGIEACGGSHYWARVFEEHGHTVKIMSPQFVKPYVKSNKNDARDAEAIAEAITRPTMRFVPKKTIEQQDILMYEQLKTFTAQVSYYDKKINIHAATDPRCVAVQDIEGIGPITASAIVATIGDPNVFKNGREVSAWLGLTPKQNSSGNKVILGGITKRGDRYVRKLLVHGARSVINTCDNKTDKKNQWVADKKQRCGYNKAAVALANKNARVIWAMLATGECYQKALSHEAQVA